MSIASNELGPQPKQPNLFPLPDKAVRFSAAAFSGYSQKELDVVRDAKVELLHEGGPTRWLFEGRVRPELTDQPESVQQAYRAGVGLATVIVHTSLQAQEGQGQRLVPCRNDYDSMSEQLREQVPWRFGRKPTANYLNGISPHFRKVHDLSGFLENAQAAAYFGYLRESWALKHLDFISPEQRQKGLDDLITLGIRDTFGMFALSYGETTQPKADNFLYDPNKHFKRDDPDKRGDDQFTSGSYSLSLEREDLHVYGDLSWLGGREPACGYVGEALWTVSDAEGQPLQASKPVDVWWRNEVPSGVAIASLRLYESGYVATDADRQNSITQVGFKKSLQEFSLSPQDSLIVRGRNGAIVVLAAPFAIEDKMVDRFRKTVELLAFCRSGEVLPLISHDRLSHPEQQAFVEVAESIQERFANDLSEKKVKASLRIGSSILPDSGSREPF